MSLRSCVLSGRRAHSFKCGLGDRGYCGGQGLGRPKLHPVFTLYFVEKTKEPYFEYFKDKKYSVIICKLISTGNNDRLAHRNMSNLYAPID